MRLDYSGERVRAYSDGAYREIVLSSPERHNALDVQMRDELVLVLRAALYDREVRGVGVIGAGPSFCSGGDLTEFGQTLDPARAHLARTARSLPWLFAQLRFRLVVGVHGHCIGAGVELAAFACCVIAARDTVFRLPEIQMGLLPGCGGTVSVPRRVGRGRALLWMLTAAEIGSAEASEYGLVDKVVETTALVAEVRAAAREL